MQFERRPERVLFGDLHYLALVARPERLRSKPLARPAWRGWDETRVAETLEFNDWVRANAELTEPPIALVDTSDADPDRVADDVADWIEDRLPDY